MWSLRALEYSDRRTPPTPPHSGPHSYSCPPDSDHSVRSGDIYRGRYSGGWAWWVMSGGWHCWFGIPSHSPQSRASWFGLGGSEWFLCLWVLQGTWGDHLSLDSCCKNTNIKSLTFCRNLIQCKSTSLKTDSFIKNLENILEHPGSRCQWAPKNLIKHIAYRHATLQNYTYKKKSDQSMMVKCWWVFIYLHYHPKLGQILW